MKNVIEISNSDDILDSRDIIARIEELESIREDLKSEIDDTNAEIVEARKALKEFDESDDGEELTILKKLEEEASGSPDWIYGETLIRDSYFSEYAEELCKDIGDIPKELPWYIANHIDWDGVAREIKADYMSVDFDGIEYWIRA